MSLMPASNSDKLEQISHLIGQNCEDHEILHGCSKIYTVSETEESKTQNVKLEHPFWKKAI